MTEIKPAGSPSPSPDGEAETAAGAGEEIVRFFLALPADARREYALLAELDRRYGEDVLAEQRSEGKA